MECGSGEKERVGEIVRVVRERGEKGSDRVVREVE